MPYQQNPFFTGRQEILELLHAALCPDKAARQPQSFTLNGLGGIGKTQVAIEYARRHTLDYTSIFWVGAESYETLIADFINIAYLLGISQKQDQDQDRIVEEVKRWFTRHDEWLLVLDNAEDIETITPFLPVLCRGSILITTRLQAVGTLTTQCLKMPGMSRDEGVAFLLTRSRLLRPDALDALVKQKNSADYDVAKAIVEVTNGLPLALDQAAAYIEETHCSQLDYLHLLQEHPEYALQERGAMSSGHPFSVMKTFSLSFEKLRVSHPIAIDLLTFCAFIASDAIPEELLLAGFPFISHTDSPASTFNVQLNTAIKELLKYSLIERNVQSRVFHIHRLVQATLIHTLTQEQYVDWSFTTLRVIERCFPAVTGHIYTSYSKWSDCEQFLPHALACIQRALDLHIVTPEVVHLLQNIGNYLCERGRLDEAQRFLQHALTLSRQLEHAEEDVMKCLEGLAQVHYYQGQYEQSISLAQEHLALCTSFFGATHDAVFMSLDSIGWIYMEQNLYAQAEIYLKQAFLLAKDREVSFPVEIAHLGLGLAVCYIEQRKQEYYVQVKEELLQGYEIVKSRLGEIHPLTSGFIYCLGLVYHALKEEQQAEHYLLHERQCLEKVYPHHPWAAFHLNGIAKFYYDLGRFGDAMHFAMQAVDLAEQVMNVNHPWRIACIQTLTRIQASTLPSIS